jgi:hypothetical protein
MRPSREQVHFPLGLKDGIQIVAWLGFFANPQGFFT